LGGGAGGAAAAAATATAGTISARLLAWRGRLLRGAFFLSPRFGSWRPRPAPLAGDPLLVVLQLLLHEPAGDGILLEAKLVVSAIGTAPPSLRICFLAG